MIKKYLLALFLISVASLITGQSDLKAQEICNNGIDDDGDNLIDGYDPDCPCDNNALLCQPSCEFSIPGGPLNFTQKWTSAAEVPIYMTPLSGDVNNDGVPDIVILSSNNLETSEPRRAKDILIINGATGATITTITTPFAAWVGPSQIAIADVDNDGFAEIFLAAMDHSSNALADRRFLFCYSHTGALKWKSDQPYGFASGTSFGGALGIADFNADGIPELYIYNTLFNARTGVKLCDGGDANPKGIMTNQSWGNASTTMAADLLPNPGLELAAGNAVYIVTITNVAGTTGNSMTPVLLPGRSDGFTSVADIDLDGFLDVVVARAGNPGEVYVWNPRNTPTLLASINLPNTGGSGWIGPPFIGDIDNDCTPEIGVTRANRVFALKYNSTTTLTQKWALTTTDASGFTGITMFDFNQDGTQEIVYRDETTLRILNGSGSSPVVVGIQQCTSGTGAEMPIVADVDGDGQADICVTCATANPSVGRVFVFRSSSAPWAPSRSVWNQYNYNFVNVNNNLRIPVQPQPPQALISTVFCPFQGCNQNRPFNSFLTQVTLLTQDGCPVYPATDLSIQLEGTPVCNNSSLYTLQVRVTNVGQAASNPGFPIQFYAGNPFTGTSALRLTTSPSSVSTLTSIQPGQSEILTIQVNIGPAPKPFTLHVVLNDDGTQALPITFPASTVAECGFTNNTFSITNVDCCPAGDLAISSFTPPSPTFCAGSGLNLSVTATSSAGLTNAQYLWTTPQGGTFNTQTIVANQNGSYQVQVVDDVFCAVTGNVAATQVPLPTPANAGPDQTVCTANASLSGNAPTIGTGLWTVLSGGATLSNPSSPSSGVGNLQVGINEFIWTITNGGICISRDTVVINRLQPPTVSSAGPNQSVCATTATLAANTPVVGTGVWTVVSGSGTFANPNNPSTTVSNLGVGNNVFRWTISNGICLVSSSQVTITRSLNPTPSNAGQNQNICGPDAILAANLPLVGTGQWSVVSGSGTFSNPNAPNILVFGLSNGPNVFSWTISNGACPPSTSNVTITRIENPTIANAGPNQTICTESTTMAANTPNVGFGQWALVSGNAIITDSFSPTTSITNIEVGTVVLRWSIISFPCPSSFSDITITRIPSPTDADAGPNQEICANQTTLAANTPLVGSGLWTVLSGSGTFADATNPTTSVSNLGIGANVFQWTISNSICQPSASTVTITQSEAPSPVSAGSSFSVCASTSTLSAVPPVIGTGQWSVVSGGASLSDPLSPSPTVSNLSFGPNVFRWIVTSGACSQFVDVTITRDQPPSIANAGQNQSICGNATALSANLPAIGTGTWSVVSGTASFNNVNDPLSSVSGLSVGNNVLQWTISNGVCPSQSATVTILVSENPVNVSAGPNQALCMSSASLNATAPVSGSGLWSVVSGSGTFSNVGLNTSDVSNLGIGVNVFRWTVTNGACEVFAQVTITRDALPTQSNAGVDQTICADQTTLAGNAPVIGNGVWTIQSGSATIDDASNPSSSLSGIGIGSVTLNWTISNGTCPPSSSSVTITRIENPTTASAGSNQTVCSTTATLSANTPAVGTGTWTTISGSGVVDIPSSPTSQVSNLSFGVNTFRWTISNGICNPSVADVTITRLQEPDAANAGPDVETCTNSVALNAVQPVVGIGTWSVVTGNATFSNINDPQATVSNLDQGINVLQWTLSNGICPTNSDQVVVERNKFNIIVDAGTNQQICVDNALLNAASAGPGTGTWTIISGQGTISEVNNNTSTVTSIGVGTLVLQWTVTLGSCQPQSTQVSIQRFAEPSAAVAGTDQTLCADVANLNATTPAVGNGQWTSQNPNLIITNATDPQTSVSNLATGENVLTWTISNGPCAAVSDNISLFRDEVPTGVNAGANQLICADEVTLSATSPSVGTGEWSVISGGGNISNPLNSTTQVTGLILGVSVFEWTVTNGSCEVTSQVSITRNAEPTIADAGQDLTLCATQLTVTGNAPVIGSASWQVVSGGAQIVTSTGQSAEISGLQTGQNILEYTISNPGCPPSTDQVIITRDQSPTPAFAGVDQVVCSDALQLAANAPQFGSGSWTILSGSASISNASIENPFVNGLSEGINQFEWTVASGNTCPDSKDTLSIQRDLPPSTSDAGSDQTVCGNSTSLSGNLPVIGSGSWNLVSGNGSFVNSSSPTTVVNSLASGVNEFEWVVTNGVCIPSADLVSITSVTQPSAFAGFDQTLCVDNTSFTAVLPSGASGQWFVLVGNGIIDDITDPVSAVTGLAQGVNTFGWIVEVSGCPPDTAYVNLNFTCNEPPVLFNEQFTLDQGTSISNNVLANGDFDPDGTTLTVNTTPIVPPTNGSFTLNANGDFTYTPNPSFVGTDFVVVQVCDNGIPLPAACAFDTLTFIVNPVNQPPVIVNDNVTTTVNTPISGNVNTNNSDPDGDTLTADTTPVSGPSNGNITINPDGSFNYTPNTDFIGNDTIVINICDNGTPQLCGLDTLVIVITEPQPNQPPVIVNDNVTTTVNTPISGNVNINNSDPDGNTLTADTTPVSGPSNGNITINPDGSFTYTPNTDFIGNDTIVINICDNGTPQLCGLDTLVIVITEPLPNQPPVIVNDNVTTTVNTPISGNVNTNNTDPDGDTLTADTTPVSGPSNGSITINPDGSFTYTPNTDFIGNDTIVINICDNGTPQLCGLDTLVIVITEPLPNQPPVIVNDNVTTTVNTAVSGNVNTNNTDPDGDTLTADTTPVSGPSNGNITINPDGSFTYTPNTDFIGSDTIVINICDNGTPQLCGLDTLVIVITEPLPNQPPVIVNDNVNTTVNTTVSGNVNTNNSDPDGNTLTADNTPVSGPSNGSITINPDGSFTYTPNTDFIGSDTIVINICDNGTPQLCGLDTLVIVITEPLPNQPPVIVNDNVTTTVNTPISGNVNTNNSDPDGNTLTADTTPVSGPSNGNITINPDGSFTYTPNTDFIGSDTIVINICDNGTPQLCGLDTLVIVVEDIPPVNEPPVTVNETIVLNEDESFSGNVLENGDVDPEGTNLSVDTSNITGPGNGTFTIDTNGNFTYTPNPNFNGHDTVIVLICDEGSPIACSPDTIVFIVNPVNDPPVVQNENVSISNTETASGNALANDNDDLDSSDLFVSGVLVPPANGTFTIDSLGNYTYVPNTCFVGIDTVIVEVCDSGIPLPSICLNDTLFITVNPTLISANAGADQSICVTSTVLSAEAIPAGAIGSWSVVSGSAVVADSINPNSTVTQLQIGENLLVWTISYCDSTYTDTVAITVNPLPDVPFAGEDQTVCGSTLTLQANTPTTGTGIWSTLSDAVIASPNTAVTNVQITTFSTNPIAFIWTTSLGNCSLSDTLFVLAVPQSVPEILSDQQSICQGQPISLISEYTAYGPPSVSWSIVSGQGTFGSPTDSVTTLTSDTPGQLIISFNLTYGPCSITDFDTLTVIPSSQSPCNQLSGVFIPEGFSPNNDGTHDFFVISGTNGRNVKIKIFNRWGVIVYENDNYQNDWDGRAYKGLTIDNQALPESTYYYIITIGPGNGFGEEEFKGYITLWR